MHGVIKGIAESEDVNFCPNCGNRRNCFDLYGVILRCNHCGYRYAVIDVRAIFTAGNGKDELEEAYDIGYKKGYRKCEEEREGQKNEPYIRDYNHKCGN